MPKFKKPPQNAYFIFMKKKKAEMEAQGHRFPRGMQDVASAVNAEWKALPPDKKAVYEQLAKEAKEKERNNFDNKFTTSGESYASLNRRLAAVETENAELKSLLNRILRSEIPGERIFVLVQAIPSCEVGLDNANEKKEYYPLEISLAAFSLKDGFICQYWTLINTMSVPRGYASSAKDVSEETGLPEPGSKVFPLEAPEAINYNKIMTNIRQFVETWCSGYPEKKCMVFVTESNITSVSGCIEWLVKNADENVHVNQLFFRNLKFYSLETLVIELAVLGHEINRAYKSELHQFRLHDSAKTLLCNGCYDYNEQITCRYHKKEDCSMKMSYCCKNYLLRRIFIILEEFTEVYSCRMTNRHKINSYFETTMPDHLKERIPQPIGQVYSNTNPEYNGTFTDFSSSEYNDRSEPDQCPDNLSHETSELGNEDLGNSDQKFQDQRSESGSHFEQKLSPWAPKCENGKDSSDEVKVKTVHALTVSALSTGGDALINFSSSESDVKREPYQCPDNSSHESSEVCVADLGNIDQKFREESGSLFNRKLPPLTPKCENGKGSNAVKQEAEHAVSVSTGGETPTDFSEKKKRKRSSSPLSSPHHISLHPAKFDRREDSTRSSSGICKHEPEQDEKQEMKCEHHLHIKNEFGSYDNITQLPRERGGYDEIDIKPMKKE